jgi:hypothetical protein
MAEEPDLTFPPFRLDLANERLWRGTEPLTLRPKAFLLLRYLAEHPERLLTQEELLKAIWQHGYVSDGLLRGYIRKLRKLLGDDAKNPRTATLGAHVDRRAEPDPSLVADHEHTVLLPEWLLREGLTYPAMPMDGGQPNYFTINGRAYPATAAGLPTSGNRLD